MKAFINNNKGKLLAAGTVAGSAVLGAGAGAAVGGALFGIGALVGAPIGAVVGVLGGSVVVGGMYLGHKVYHRTDAKARFLDLIDPVQGEELESKGTRLDQRQAKRKQATQQKQDQAVMKEVSKAKEEGTLQQLFEKYQKEDDQDKMHRVFRAAVKLCSSNQEKVGLASLCEQGKERWLAKIIAETATPEDLKELYKFENVATAQSIYAVKMLSQYENRTAQDVLKALKELDDNPAEAIKKIFIDKAIQKAQIDDLMTINNDYPEYNSACVKRAEELLYKQRVNMDSKFKDLDKILSETSPFLKDLDKERSAKYRKLALNYTEFFDRYKLIGKYNNKNINDLLGVKKTLEKFSIEMNTWEVNLKKELSNLKHGGPLNSVQDTDKAQKIYDKAAKPKKSILKKPSVSSESVDTQDKKSVKFGNAEIRNIERSLNKNVGYTDGQRRPLKKQVIVSRSKIPEGGLDEVLSKKKEILNLDYQNRLINIINLEQKKDNVAILDATKMGAASGRGKTVVQASGALSGMLNNMDAKKIISYKDSLFNGFGNSGIQLGTDDIEPMYDIKRMKNELINLEMTKMQWEGQNPEESNFRELASQRVEAAIKEFREKYAKDPKLKALAAICIVDKAKVEEAEKKAGGNDTTASAS